MGLEEGCRRHDPGKGTVSECEAAQGNHNTKKKTGEGQEPAQRFTTRKAFWS